MSNSSLVSYIKLSPNYSVVENKKNKKIAIHHMAGNCSIETCGNIFANPARKASSNYGIGTDGRIGMYVEEKHRSWCTSSRALDGEAITIEVANDGGRPNWHVSDKALAALIDLCTDICKRNGIEKLVYTGDKTGNLMKHEWYANTTCPGPYLGGKFPYIAEEVNKRLAGQSSSNSQTEPAISKKTILRYGSNGTQVKSLQEKLIFIGYSCGSKGADGSYGKATESAVREFQGNGGLVADGIYGPKTQAILEDVYAFAKSYPLEKFIQDVQSACGAKVDGIAGPETLSKTVTVSKKTNKKHPVVKAIQKRLYALGYATVGKADGSAGSKFDKAVKEFQKDHGRYVDGEVTAKQVTWKKLLGMKD